MLIAILFWRDLSLSQFFNTQIGHQKDCCGLTRLAAKQNTGIRSPSPIPSSPTTSPPQWDGGQYRKKIENLWVEVKTVY